jgi:hypothetical protein
MTAGRSEEIRRLEKLLQILANSLQESLLLPSMYIAKDYYLVSIAMQEPEHVKDGLEGTDTKILMLPLMLNGSNFKDIKGRLSKIR